MPTYDHACASCGEFAALRPLSRRQEDVDCPRCGRAAPRILGGVPALAGTAAATRRMTAATQRASGSDGSYPRMRCGGGCVCC
jgi:putative FmdB family regulatory protein